MNVFFPVEHVLCLHCAVTIDSELIHRPTCMEIVLGLWACMCHLCERMYTYTVVCLLVNHNVTKRHFTSLKAFVLECCFVCVCVHSVCVCACVILLLWLPDCQSDVSVLTLRWRLMVAVVPRTTHYY